jgi:hypothetical protein
MVLITSDVIVTLVVIIVAIVLVLIIILVGNGIYVDVIVYCVLLVDLLSLPKM